jgi:UDP-N-acetylmuramyl tripeptide synthase
MQLADLIQPLEIISVNGPIDREIAGISYDSRRVAPGNLFVAIKGDQFDGHAFVEQAIDKGAIAVVCEDAGLSQRDKRQNDHDVSPETFAATSRPANWISRDCSL